MTRTKGLLFGLSGLAALSMVAWPVYAHCGKCAGDCKTMVAKMDEGKTTLSAAIAAAEAKAKGKAVAAYTELEGGKIEFEVYCMVGDKLMEVEVDGTGKAGEMKDAKMIGGSDAAADPHAGHDHAKDKKEMKKEEKKEEKKAEPKKP